MIVFEMECEERNRKRVFSLYESDGATEIDDSDRIESNEISRDSDKAKKLNFSLLRSVFTIKFQYFLCFTFRK